MGKYNSGKVYNASSFEDGLTYNYLASTIIIVVNDGFRITENFKFLLAKLFLKEQIQAKYSVNVSTEITHTDYLSIKDTKPIEVEVLIKALEKLDITETFLNAVALITIFDNQNIISESVMAFSERLISDNINFDDRASFDIDVMINIAEKYQLNDVAKIFSDIKLKERLKIADKDPQKAVTDFLIGKIEGLDERFTGISPFDMYFIKNESSIPVMPTTESTYIDLPNTDGSIIQETVYKNRFFDLVVVSMQGLQPTEMEKLKQKITKILDSTKDNSKKLTFQDSDTTFNVKYSGTADIRSGASWVKANLPFEAQPYAQKTFATEIDGNGLIVNDGDTNLGVVCKIRGECTRPNFMIDETEFLWNDTVPKNKTLVIDNENMTCYLEDSSGNKTNAMTKLIKGNNFYIVPKGSNADITCLTEETRISITTSYSPLILWYGRQD